jgi:hypothetical protein
MIEKKSRLLIVNKEFGGGFMSGVSFCGKD